MAVVDLQKRSSVHSVLLPQLFVVQTLTIQASKYANVSSPPTLMTRSMAAINNENEKVKKNETYLASHQHSILFHLATRVSDDSLGWEVEATKTAIYHQI